MENNKKQPVSPTPAQGMFQPRPFVVQRQTEEQSEQPDIKTALQRAKRYGHSLDRIKSIEPPVPAQIPQIVQAKLTIGQPGDRYEQEADRVAAQVVNSFHAPTSQQSKPSQTVQRQEESEEELQAKPEITALQRQEEPEEELQAKPSISDQQRSPLSPEVQREAMPEEEDLQTKSILQCQEAIGGGEASTDLESAINSARGGGQSLDAGLQQSMGQAMGADFSGVKVHTDAQADQLNQSIQARAFTTGRDVFFRSGEYNPESREGEELIAHELTHVVQQNGQAVQRSPLSPEVQREAMPEEDLQAKSTVQSEEAIAELRDFQEMANNSPQTKQAAQLQVMADNYSDQQQQPVQKKESLTGATTSLTTALSSGHVVQRNVKIKGKKTEKYANFGAFQQSRFYQPLITNLTQRNFPPEVIEFHLKQLFSTNVEFENEEHFREALIYDIMHKSMPEQEHTLQEQYMTLYGWKKRKAPGKQPATAAGAGEREPETLKVYRTMKLDDWTELEKGNHAKLSGHLGDFKQAQNYLYRKSPEPKVLVEFTLRPGAERVLFSSNIMAFPDVKEDGKENEKSVPKLIKDTLIQEGMSDSFAKASKNEGTAPDKVGVKSEGGEAGFSLGIGGGTSPQVFMSLVASMKVIGRSQAE
jgi:hypothetical protein